MKRVFISIVFIICSLSLFPQNIAVKSFRLLENDLDAQVTHPEIDMSNG